MLNDKSHRSLRSSDLNVQGTYIQAVPFDMRAFSSFDYALWFVFSFFFFLFFTFPFRRKMCSRSTTRTRDRRVLIVSLIHQKQKRSVNLRTTWPFLQLGGLNVLTIKLPFDYLNRLPNTSSPKEDSSVSLEPQRWRQTNETTLFKLQPRSAMEPGTFSRIVSNLYRVFFDHFEFESRGTRFETSNSWKS